MQTLTLHNGMKRVIAIVAIVSVIAITTITLASIPLTGHAQVVISSQLDIGSTGSQVTALQTFLAADRTIYPEGLITGYYGPLTASAVSRFQARYGIATVGRVGPITLSKLNSLMVVGVGVDTHAPVASGISVQTRSDSAILTWNTNEMARTKVFYGTQPPTMFEASANFTEPIIVAPVSVVSPGFQSSQSANITGLSPNTTYYYVTESIDATGNVTVTLPAAFTTQS